MDARNRCAWRSTNSIAPEVLFFIELESRLPDQLAVEGARLSKP